MLLSARRFGIITILVLGTILAFCDSFLNVSPIIWLTIPVLCCSVVTGIGIQALVLAGFNDRKWVLAAVTILSTLGIVTLFLAIKYYQVFAGLGKGAAALFTETAKMYIFGAVATAIIFFIVRAELRIHWLRWLILSSAMVVDIFLGARFIIDKVL